jgi:acetoacetyl-CoA synthetase
MTTKQHTLPPKLWEHPDPKSTNAWKFMQHVNSKYGLRMQNWEDLHEWSVKSNSAFWEEVFRGYVFHNHARTQCQKHR